MRIPIFLKIMTPLVIVIILSVAVSGYFVFQESTQRLQNEITGRLINSAKFVSQEADRVALQALHTPSDYEKPEYANVRKLLDQTVEAGHLNWIGIYFLENNKLYYWVDSDGTGIGYPFFYATQNHRAIFETPTQDPLPISYTDEWGSWHGYIAPIVMESPTGQSKVIGIVEATVSKEQDVLLQQQTQQTVQTILVGGGIVAVLIALLATVVTFNRPMARLKTGALTVANGEFGHTIDLKSKDELGELATAFNDMSGQLKLRYDEIQKRNNELQMVYQIAQTITASGDDPKTVLNTILERVYEIMPFEEGEITLYVPEENALRVRGWKGTEKSVDFRLRKYPLGVGFTGNVGQNRKSFLSDDITKVQEFRPVLGNIVENPIRSYLGVPLVVGDRLVGTMEIVSTKAAQFTENNKRLLETIALQAAVAIETAEKVEAKQRALEEQISKLKIEIDEAKQQQQVNEITESDYFKRLQSMAQNIRSQRSGKTE